MCYTGSCPYEDGSGECKLTSRQRQTRCPDGDEAERNDITDNTTEEDGDNEDDEEERGA